MFNQILITSHTAVFTYFIFFNSSHICTAVIALLRHDLKDLAFLVLGETCWLSALCIGAVLFCQKVRRKYCQHETFSRNLSVFFFYPAVCAVAMNFNSSIILCLSSIDICPPIEFHSLDILCAFSFMN